MYLFKVYGGNSTGLVTGNPRPLTYGDVDAEHKAVKRTTVDGIELYTCASHKPLMASVKNNQLFDAKKWIGYIAANYQLQFDEGVAQNGALYTSGFSVCNNNRLALGNSTVFYRCLSGNFYNLYDRSVASTLTIAGRSLTYLSGTGLLNVLLSSSLLSR